MHDLLKKSFVALRSAGMRLAPETLLLELMREVFFERRSESGTTREVDPRRDRLELSVEERAVLYAMRGRRKKTTRSQTRDFFAPAYPTLARGAWIGQKRERAIANYLWRGPVAQHVRSRGSGAEATRAEISKQMVEALAGDQGRRHLAATQDILYGALPGGATGGIRSCRGATTHVMDIVRLADRSTMDIGNDEMARRMTIDLQSLCSLERRLPRMQWLHAFMTWLRLSLAMWLLAHMQVTRLIYRWAVSAASGKTPKGVKDIKRALRKRNRGLLRPTTTPTRELLEHIEGYMKCRIELNLLLGRLGGIEPDAIRDKFLAVDPTGGAVGLADLLHLLYRVADRLVPDRDAGSTSDQAVRRSLTREAEGYAAWCAPLTKGTGTNIDEFFRVLYQTGDPREAGGHLLTQRDDGRKRSFEVFPGPMLLKTLAYCAAAEKNLRSDEGGGGKLMLKDLEEVLACYGIDFASAASARPRLIADLRSLGLLTGSPDAGSSVAVTSPYPWRNT